MDRSSLVRSDLRAMIVDVAARLLQDHGPTAVTTRGVAKLAGVQPPAIYRLFGDKDGLMEAVAEKVMATYVSAKAATAEAATESDVDPIQDLRAGWQTQIDFGVANPTLFRLLSDPDRVLHSQALRAGREVLRSRVHRVALTGRLRVSEERAVDLIQAAGAGTVQTLLGTPPHYRDPGLADAMLEAVLDQVLTDTPLRRDDDLLAASVALRAATPLLVVLTEAERHMMCEWLDRAIAELQSANDGDRRRCR